jgi:SAM-dependent methyltransferase
MRSGAALNQQSAPVTDPECSRFLTLSEELRHEARLSGDPDLLSSVEEFLRPYMGVAHTLPRSPIERLNAQRLLRRLLIARRCYGPVYGWYEAFKSPFGEDFAANFDLYVRHLRAAADGFGWINGYDTVLECGCGPESLGLVLSHQNRRWIASDIYVPEVLDQLKDHFKPGHNFEFQVINGVTLAGVPDRSVDAVISRSFFEHLLVDDATQHLEQAYRVLRPGGDFICLCPAGIGPPSDVTQEFPEFDTPQGLHIKEYRVSELNAELERIGFGPVRTRFLRLRGLSGLPQAVNRRNQIPIGFARLLESMAKSTWPAARWSPSRRRLWKQVWGHVGATNLLVVARKER